MDRQRARSAEAVHRVLVKFDAHTDEIIDVVVKLAEELVIIRREVKEQLPR
jgi:hypothetical protein